MVHYNPNRGKKPVIEGEAEMSGSTRKASVGIVGPSGLSGSYNQSIMLPKEFEDILANPGMNKKVQPCYKYTRQKSTSNETISYNDVRTIIKGPPGTEPQGKSTTHLLLLF